MDLTTEIFRPHLVFIQARVHAVLNNKYILYTKYNTDNIYNTDI